jgi:hypothetical protein
MSPEGLVEPNLDTHLGQAIACGGWPLVFRSGWAQGVVEDFSLVGIPRAPLWLRGAFNADGRILPVVDLVAYLEPSQPLAHLGRQHRLLLGKKNMPSDEMSVALMFSGLPMQIEYTRQILPHSPDLPERLRAICTHRGQSDRGDHWYEIDTDLFSQALLIHLM